jgi:hypothetical protein
MIIHTSYSEYNSLIGIQFHVPVTYQPQRVQLLSDVNVFGGQFLCWWTLRMVIVKRHTVWRYCFVLARSRVISGIMYRMSLSLSLSKIITFRAMQDTSASRRGPVRPVGVLYNIIPYIYHLSPDQHNGCAWEAYGRTRTTFVNDIYIVNSDCMKGIDLFWLEI